MKISLGVSITKQERSRDSVLSLRAVRKIRKHLTEMLYDIKAFTANINQPELNFKTLISAYLGIKFFFDCLESHQSGITNSAQ